MILVQENNDVSLLLNNSLPLHLQMLGTTTPSFFRGKRGWCQAWSWLSRALARERADHCSGKWSLELESEQTPRTLSDWRRGIFRLPSAPGFRPGLSPAQPSSSKPKLSVSHLVEKIIKVGQGLRRSSVSFLS